MPARSERAPGLARYLDTPPASLALGYRTSDGAVTHGCTVALRTCKDESFRSSAIGAWLTDSRSLQSMRAAMSRLTSPSSPQLAAT